MSNFDFLLSEKDFSSFAGVAVAAENLLHIDRDACVLNCRRAMEFAVKWMYSVDKELSMPWDDKLVSLMNGKEFRDIVQDDLWFRMDYIRKLGNNAAHESRKIRPESKRSCVWKICSCFWISWPTAMGKPIRSGHLTSPF